MSIPGSASPLLLASTAAAAGGLQISRSIRLNSADSAYFSRTPAVVGNRRTWTWSGWVKRSELGVLQQLFGAGQQIYNDGIYSWFRIDANNKLNFRQWTDLAGLSSQLTSTAVFRDTSAWFHLVFAYDSTQALDVDRVKIYINGIELTVFDSANYPELNDDAQINNTKLHTIGSANDGGSQVYYFNGYLANIHFIDGQALTPSSFTETDATTGQLIPKTYTGTYGLVSVAAATGALPILNTTDTYGLVTGTGTRTDTNSASLVLALPLSGNANDVSNSINSASTTKTTSPSGAAASSAQSIFYGGSFLFNGSGDYIAVTDNADFAFGTGNSTVEMWVYPNTLVSNDVLYDSRQSTGGTGTGFSIVVNSSGVVQTYTALGYRCISTSTLSVGKWSHIAVVRSSGTDTLFIDGIAQAGTSTLGGNYTDQKCRIGSDVNGAEAWGGYIADFRLYKGAAKYTSNFSPVRSSVNSFNLLFADNSSNTASTLGKDTSGLSNNWTPNNLSVTAGAGNDSLVDSPTNYGTDTGVGGEVRGNYCTLNPLEQKGTTLTNGNLNVSGATGGDDFAYGTIGTSTGKWYFEATLSSFTNLTLIGIDTGNKIQLGGGPGDVDVIVWLNDGRKLVNGTYTATGQTYTTNDVVGVSYDFTNNQVIFYKNGTLVLTISTTLTGKTYKPIFWVYGTPAAFVANFGQRAFAYTAPSGFKALNTANLPAPLVTKSSTVFDVITYTGTGSSLTLPNGSSTPTSIAFTPDFVWLKGRSGATDHALYDAVRGVQKDLVSNSTSAETTETTGLTAFGTNTLTVGSLAKLNTSSATYVAWAWNAGGSTVTNTQGSITSQVRANATAGFSVCSWTAASSGNFTWGHGLGVEPYMVIVKTRASAGYNWRVYHKSIITTVFENIDLNSTAAKFTSGTNMWGAALPTSTVVGSTANNTVGASDASIAYCFAPVVGYSSFGSYVGNGSSDGVFVFCGFRPKWVLFKCSSTTSAWNLTDTTRQTYNVQQTWLQPNTSDAEYTGGSSEMDILSNGFKLRNSNSPFNTSSATYIYAAFAEAPINYSRARQPTSGHVYQPAAIQ